MYKTNDSLLFLFHALFSSAAILPISGFNLFISLFFKQSHRQLNPGTPKNKAQIYVFFKICVNKQ